MTNPVPWWRAKPYRLIQTNLREIDAALDLDEYMGRLKAFRAEIVLFNTGGIVANYPTRLPFHFPNPHAKGDLVGRVLERAHAEGIRYLARFDFSKVNETLAARNPAWLYRSVAGGTVNYNGQVHACVNGRYQQEHALEILGEALDRYPVDGVFFNMIGYQTHDYSGVNHGPCQCDACRERFERAHGRPLPTVLDPADPAVRAYEAFRRETSRELFWKIANFIKARRPEAAIATYTHEGVDIFRKESNTGIDRPLPEWTHSATDNVKSVRASWPGMAAANTAVHFIDFPYRHSAVSPELTAARLAGDLVAGGWIDLYVIGTLEGQEDRLAFREAEAIFGFHADHERWFTGTRPVADVALVDPARSRAFGAGAEYRGLYRILTEGHVLFDVIDDSVLAAEDGAARLRGYRAVVLPDASCLTDAQAAALDAYAAAGGALLATGAAGARDGDGNPRPGPALRALGVRRVEVRRPRERGSYLRVRPEDREGIAGLEDLDLIFLDTEFADCEPDGGVETRLRRIPPAMFGPPEKCYYTGVSATPGMLLARPGSGRAAYLPWKPGAQYVKLAHPGVARLIEGVLDGPLGLLRRLTTNAPALVELAAHREREGRWHWIGLVNHSGQLGTAFHPPLPVHGTTVRYVAGAPVRRARALRAGAELEVSEDGGAASVTLPRLDRYEVVVLETGA